MRKTILYIAMSLDGYIADRDGGVAWLAGDGSSRIIRDRTRGFTNPSTRSSWGMRRTVKL